MQSYQPLIHDCAFASLSFTLSPLFFIEYIFSFFSLVLRLFYLFLIPSSHCPLSFFSLYFLYLSHRMPSLSSFYPLSILYVLLSCYNIFQFLLFFLILSHPLPFSVFILSLIPQLLFLLSLMHLNSLLKLLFSSCSSSCIKFKIRRE